MERIRTLSKKIGVNLWKVEAREKDQEGNTIKCPTLAYVHVIVDCPFGDLVLKGYRVLKGTDGKPFVATPGRTRQLYDERGKPISKRRYDDIGIDGDGNREFKEAIKKKVLSAFNS